MKHKGTDRRGRSEGERTLKMVEVREEGVCVCVCVCVCVRGEGGEQGETEGRERMEERIKGCKGGGSGEKVKG